MLQYFTGDGKDIKRKRKEKKKKERAYSTDFLEYVKIDRWTIIDFKKTGLTKNSIIYQSFLQYCWPFALHRKKKYNYIFLLFSFGSIEKDYSASMYTYNPERKSNKLTKKGFSA